ncbi:MAG: stage II sporulation protein R [Clostridiales bacterium]|nr:stage II sporulation protein R [Clostridiales bacterium]
MKKILIAAIALVVVLAVIIAIPSGKSNADFLRMHIRADSNDQADQNVKFQVKSAVVDYLTPYLANAQTKQEAMSVVKGHLRSIEKVCDRVLAANGFSYTSHAKLCQEEFPDRNYGDVTLKAGVYDALIIELGSGSGNNWWCVVYPPLCFVGGESNGTNSIIYKSKLLEIINNWKASH